MPSAFLYSSLKWRGGEEEEEEEEEEGTLFVKGDRAKVGEVMAARGAIATKYLKVRSLMGEITFLGTWSGFRKEGCLKIILVLLCTLSVPKLNFEYLKAFNRWLL